MADYTALGLIAKVRRYAFLPTYDEGTVQYLLALLNDAQLDYLQPLLESTREEYRTSTVTYDVTNGRLSYPIPSRAIASNLMMIQSADSQGNVWLMVELRPQDWPPVGLMQYPNGPFYIEQNQIKFYVQPPTGTLQIRFSRRLSELVTSEGDTSFRTISTINTGTKTLTLSGDLDGSTFDLVQANPQFDMLSCEAVASGGGSSTLVFTETLPNDLAVGDYVCTPNQAPVCLGPLETHSLLCQYVAWVVLQAKGDMRAAQLQALSEATRKRVLELLEPRPTKGRPVINYSAPGWLRWTGYGTRGGII